MNISPLKLLCCLFAVFCLQSILCFSQKQLSTIVIDPGHGGKDPGAVGKKTQEKNIVLNVANKLGKMLNDSLPSVKTVFTRSTDVFIPLDRRAEIANKSDADVFVSIHANSSTNKSIHGSETFVLGLHRSKENLAVAQKENSVITMEDEYTNKYEGFDPSQPESYIIFELMQNVYLEQSISVASLLQNSFANHGRDDRGVKQAGFLVLRQTSMPSVLVELGFISNPEEEAYMSSDEGTNELVYSLFCAIRSYKNLYDGLNVVSMTNAPSQVQQQKKVVVSEDDLWPDSVNFRIQIAASKSALSFDTLSFQPVSHMVENGINKYMIGMCSSYDSIVELHNSVKSRFPGCFIVAFEGREKISLRSAKKKIK